MPVGRLFALHVTARLGDFFDERTHWQRRLWNVSLVLSLRELLEAAQEQGRALHPAAVANLAESVRARIALDPGAGSELERSALARYVRSDLAVGGAAYEGIQVALEDIEEKYLARWAVVLAESDSPPNRERAARALAAHLLDAGRTPQFLNSWLNETLKSGELSAVALFEQAQVLLGQQPTLHDVFVPFEIEPRMRASRPSEWIDSAAAARWLRASGHTGVRQRGGLSLRFRAHGQIDAVNQAADVTDRFLARVAVGERTFGRFAPVAYLAGGRKESLIRGRRVEVRALSRENAVADLEGRGDIDAALELLSHLQSGPTAVAAAAGWSAVESLLLGPGDEEESNIIAADRLATLVACSWPRAELTDLAWSRIRAADDTLSRELGALATNRERAHRISEEFAEVLRGNPQGRLEEIELGSDIAAMHRLRPLFVDPRKLLIDVRAYASESLRRLYRQRNLVLHGGRTEAVALDAALRTASPLVGAGLDRIVHGALVGGSSPLQLLAKADFEIERAGSPDAPNLVDFLE